MLKRLVLSLLLLSAVNCLSATNNDEVYTAAAQGSINAGMESDDKISRNLFFELAGPSFSCGIGYDQRFRPNSVFGFRAGVGFINCSYSDSPWYGACDGGPYTRVESKGVTFPLEINAIMGKRASKFELGIGATSCLLNRIEEKYMADNWDRFYFYKKEGMRVNIMGFLNIGYRLQRKSGFFMRTGFTFFIGDLKYSPIDGKLPWFNLSLGYTIQ